MNIDKFILNEPYGPVQFNLDEMDLMVFCSLSVRCSIYHSV